MHHRLYDEPTFRHLLTIERKRAAGAGLLLLLVSVRGPKDRVSRMPATLRGPIALGLSEALREVDLVGWYRQGRTLAAVLSQRGRPPAGAGDHIVTRVADAVTCRLTPQMAARLHVRIVEPGLGGRRR